MTWILYLLPCLVFVALSALFSGSETGIYCVNRLRLRLLSDRGQKRATRLRHLLEDEQKALAVILVGTNVANYLVTVTVALLLASRLNLSDRAVELYTTVAVTPLLFVFGEVVPKNLFQREPDHLLYRCSLPLTVAHRVLLPLAWLIQRLTAAVLRILPGGRAADAPLDHRDRVAGLLEEAMAAGISVESHGDFVRRVFALPGTPVTSVMVPLNHVEAISTDADREGLAQVARRTPHTRLPVYDGNKSRLVGFVRVDDLIATETWQSVRAAMQPMESVPEKSTVAAAIVQLRRSGKRMAAVTATNGRALGIVTMKDLMEEIVGELHAW